MKESTKKILFVYGTRPEAIKMAPLIKEFKKYPEKFTIKICVTGQHRQMLDQVNWFFGIVPDFDLDLMKIAQTLFDITIGCIEGLKNILENTSPDIVFVQGDTTTVLAGALAAYYKKIPVAHLEAGLRSGDIYSPFPEEMNRKIVSQISKYHFAPTELSKNNLEKEGIIKNVFVVGNTVIDALYLGLKIISENENLKIDEYFSFLPTNSRVILVTGHRRESFGQSFDDICMAIREIADMYKNIHIVYPVHLNPNVQEPVKRLLSNIENVHLIEPIEYPNMLWLINRCYFVLTDSGGIQEEAPALGKPVLVMREITERTEGIIAGTAKLVGTSTDSIIKNTRQLLDDKQLWESMSKATNPYGDGNTSKKIVEIIAKGGDM